MEYKKSDVRFIGQGHIYLRGEQRLSGVTRLIQNIVGLGRYDDMNDYVRTHILPAAAHYGTCVHNAIELFERSGVAMTKFPGLTPDAEVDVTAEVAAYRAAKPEGWATVESEFLVDYGHFASSVDAVWENGGEVALVDFKTSNLDYYAGGADALREYLSWQLSLYAHMFEHQTGAVVSRLYGLWVRGGEAELWDIERKPAEAVRCLLEDTEVQLVGGEWLMRNDAFAPYLPAKPHSAEIVVPAEVIDAINALLVAEKKAKEMKERLRDLMADSGVKKWECELFTATLSKDSESTTFDTARFKSDHAELYDKYTKKSIRKGGLRITQKNL